MMPKKPRLTPAELDQYLKVLVDQVQREYYSTLLDNTDVIIIFFTWIPKKKITLEKEKQIVLSVYVFSLFVLFYLVSGKYTTYLVSEWCAYLQTFFIELTYSFFQSGFLVKTDESGGGTYAISKP